MTTAVQLAPWPPCGAIKSVPLAIGPGVCPKHGLPQLVLQGPQAVFAYRILLAVAALVDSQGPAALTVVDGPLCCLLGDEAMEQIHRSIPAVWGLRN